jgi:hypothetical protein
MASTTFCDWCGELMELPAGREPLHLIAAGYGGPRNIYAPLDGLHYHHDRDDGESCLGEVLALLQERAKWAHDPEQESQEWRLVAREGRKLTASDKRKATRDAEREKRDAEWEKTRERIDRWTELPKPQRVEMIQGLLSDGGLTAAEIASQLEVTHPEIKVYTERIRPLVADLYKRGEIHREAEKYRDGDSIRYRYSLAEEAI